MKQLDKQIEQIDVLGKDIFYFTRGKYNNTEYEFFIPSQKNYVKININVEDEDSLNGEGCWACITDEDKKDYENNVQDDKVRVAVLANDSIYTGLPHGSYFPYRLRGETRPTALYLSLNRKKTNLNKWEGEIPE